jgi:hypothetical protein
MILEAMLLAKALETLGWMRKELQPAVMLVKRTVSLMKMQGLPILRMDSFL